MADLTIKRSEWRRGGWSSETAYLGSIRLLNREGLKCCLGFDALAAGVPSELIFDRVDPESLVGFCTIGNYIETRTTLFGSGERKNNADVVDAIVINDDTMLTDAEREAKLIPVLKKLGWDNVIFVD
jgi:hypothetical protein